MEGSVTVTKTDFLSASLTEHDPFISQDEHPELTTIVTLIWFPIISLTIPGWVTTLCFIDFKSMQQKY